MSPIDTKCDRGGGLMHEVICERPSEPKVEIHQTPWKQSALLFKITNLGSLNSLIAIRQLSKPFSHTVKDQGSYRNISPRSLEKPRINTF